MANNITNIDRSYIDNFAIKEFVKDSLIPKYFTDDDISLRTVGLVGMMSEMISNIAEDGFNATSVLFREIFPNRAEIPESIYSHAALFQLSDIFGSAASCRFVIVFDEKYIIKYSTYNSESGIYSFTIPKDLTVYVEDTPYCLDYDIIIKSVKKATVNNTIDYVFSAMYDKSGFINSISDINDTYIKIQRDSNGYIGLDVTMRQVVRSVEYHNIINNNKINLPVIDIPFTGQLVGFDVLYKTPDESTYNTQLKTQVIYSQPTVTPFCFYQLCDDNTLRLSFNARDAYFIPEYNSEIEVTLYISKGEEGNFDVYNGSNISISSETMTKLYSEAILMGAKPLGASLGGKNKPSIDTLKALTVEGYRTALSLTTEADLNYYFDDWKYRYGDSYIRFIKRRNDVYERIFGGFILLRNKDYIYKTNTLNIKLNLSDMINPEENIYMIEPGTVFNYIDNDTRDFVTFRRSSLTNKYKNKYDAAVNSGTIPFLESGYTSDDPEYLNRPASFAEFKRRNGYDDKVNVFSLMNLTDEQKLSIDNPLDNKFTFINPFLIRFKRDPNLVSLYLTVLNKDHTVDFIKQNEASYVQFMINSLNIKRTFSNDKKFIITTRISPTMTILSEKNTYINYIGTLINSEGEDISVNQPNYIFNKYTLSGYNSNNDAESLSGNSLRVLFVIYNNDKPVCYTEMYPTNVSNNIFSYKTEIFTDDHITSDGRLRLVNHITYGAPVSFSSGNETILAGTYYELPKILTDNGYNLDNIEDALIHALTVYSTPNNILTLGNSNTEKQEQLVKYIIKPILGIDINDDIPSNIEVTCNRYSPNDIKEKTNISVFSVRKLYKTENKIIKYESIVNMTHNNFILIPKENVVCKIFTLYNKKYNESNAVNINSNSQPLIPLDDSDTDNIFVGEDSNSPYMRYFWTNEYATLYDPVTFIKPLNNVRSNLYFEDCTEETPNSSLYKTIECVRLARNTMYPYDVLTPLTEGCTTNTITVEQVTGIGSNNYKYYQTTTYNITGKTLLIIYDDNDIPNSVITARWYFNGDTWHQLEDNEDIVINKEYTHDINDIRIESVPFVKYDIAFNDELIGYLMTTFMNQYDYIDSTIKNKLRNETIIDAKFYNTYGRSNNYYASKDFVNDSVILLDTLNISISFDMWFIKGTDLENAINEVKMYIKNRIESINNEGTNILHISNLMREIETAYSYVDHIRFIKINNYITDVQSLVLVFPTLEDMDKNTRRAYVPELITCDLNDIHINGSYNI